MCIMQRVSRPQGAISLGGVSPSKRSYLLPGTGIVRAPFWFSGAPKARLESLQARGGEGAIQVWGSGHTP